MSVTVKYKGSAIAELTENGTKTLKTSGKYCEADIVVENTKDSGNLPKYSDVNFYDYDGTLVAGYSISEANALTALPVPPTHDGLTFQEWNWSLEEVQSLTHIADIGANYITTDGATHLYLNITAKPQQDVYLGINIINQNGVTINWGDGTVETPTEYGISKRFGHHYAETGKYIVKIYGQFNLGCHSNGDSYPLVGDSVGHAADNRSILEKLYIGEGCTGMQSYCCSRQRALSMISTHKNFCFGHSGWDSTKIKCIVLGRNAAHGFSIGISNTNWVDVVCLPKHGMGQDGKTFSNSLSLKRIVLPEDTAALQYMMFTSCQSLEEIYIPQGVVNASSNIFRNCTALKKVEFSENFTGNISDNAFYSCELLTVFTIPSNVTAIGASAFTYAGLIEITIPENVTSIGAQAFRGCSQLNRVYLTSTTPPVLANSNAFQNAYDNMKIYVPQGSLEAYKTADNWTVYADKMQEMQS